MPPVGEAADGRDGRGAARQADGVGQVAGEPFVAHVLLAHGRVPRELSGGRSLWRAGEMLFKGAFMSFGRLLDRGAWIFDQFPGQFGFVCPGTSTPMPPAPSV